MKIWSTHEKGNDKIIAVIDQVIYKINPPEAEIDGCLSDLLERKFPLKSKIDIPFRYLTQINLEEEKDIIEVRFGKDSYEHFRVTNAETRQEIFQYFKENIPGAQCKIDHVSGFEAGKKSLIALAVVLGIGAYSYFMANELESGASINVQTNSIKSLTGISLVIASLGTKRVLVIFGILAFIAIISFIRKSLNPPVISRLNLTKDSH